MTMTKSLFGSVKDKVFKKGSNKSASTSFDRQPRSFTRSPSQTMARGSNPFSNAASRQPTNSGIAVSSGNDAPPAYSAAAPALSASSLQPGAVGRGASPNPSLASVTRDDDPYAFLTMFDTIFVIDDSGSMAFDGRWAEVSAALRTILPICTSHDKDGIDVYFLNHRSGDRAPEGRAAGGYYNMKGAQAVEKLFKRIRPNGMTPTGTRLDTVLRPYINQWDKASDKSSVKPVNIIIITDGCPQDEPDGVIAQHAAKLDRIEAPAYQVGIQFFQVGDDTKATDALRRLDDDIAEQGVRDMVDTVTWDGNATASNTLTADSILKVVLGAVVRRLDRQQTSGDHRSRT